MSKKKLFKRLAVAGAVVAIVGLSATVGTMAKYMTTAKQEVNGTLGAWDVKIDTTGFNGTIASTVTDKVATGVIVPGSSGTFNVKVKYTTSVDAEVTASDVVYTAATKGGTEVATSELPTDLQFTVDKTNVGTLDATSTERELVIPVSWSWAFTHTDDSETTGGHNKYAGMTFSGEITIKVTQVNPGANPTT